RRLVGRRLRELDLHLLGLHLHAVEDLLAEVRVLVHGAHALLALLGDEIVDAGADLVDIGCRAVELVLAERLEHGAGRGGGEEGGAPPAWFWSWNSALFRGVPSPATMAKMWSRLMSLAPACTARGTWYCVSSTISLILRPLMPPFSFTSSKRIFTALEEETP